MPTLQRIFTLEITPEKFIDNCSDIELQEVILLANKKLSWHNETPEPPEVAMEPRPAVVKALPERPKLKQKINAWTPEEEEALRALWPSMSGKEVAEKLKRSCQAVMLRASRLGLHKNKSQKRTAQPPALPTEPPPSPEEENDSFDGDSFSECEEPQGAHTQAVKTLATAKAAEAGGAKRISVRIDRRTIVQVPEGTDVEKLKAKYRNK